MCSLTSGETMLVKPATYSGRLPQHLPTHWGRTSTGSPAATAKEQVVFQHSSKWKGVVCESTHSSSAAWNAAAFVGREMCCRLTIATTPPVTPLSYL